MKSERRHDLFVLAARAAVYVTGNILVESDNRRRQRLIMQIGDKYAGITFGAQYINQIVKII